MWKPLQLRQSCTGMHGIGIKTSKGLVFDGLTRIRFENLNQHHITTILRKDWCSISILPPVLHFKHGPLSVSIFPVLCFWRFNKNYLFTYEGHHNILIYGYIHSDNWWSIDDIPPTAKHFKHNRPTCRMNFPSRKLRSHPVLVISVLISEVLR